MNADRYIRLMEEHNPKIFSSGGKGRTVKISTRELRRVIRKAFESGAAAGRAEQSLFKRIFG